MATTMRTDEVGDDGVVYYALHKERTSKPKLLCLHGWSQSQSIFEKRLGRLKKRLEAIVDLVIPTAPHEVPSIGVTDTEADTRAWWYYNETDRGDLSAFQHFPHELEYKGWITSLDSLLDIAEKEGPFAGVLGFSQGAECASMIATLGALGIEEAFASVKFAVFISGLVNPLPKNEPWYTERAKKVKGVKTLHVMGENDEYVPREQMDALVTRWSKARSYVHPGKHFVPQRKVDLDNIIEFVSHQLYDIP